MVAEFVKHYSRSSNPINENFYDFCEENQTHKNASQYQTKFSITKYYYDD